MVIKKRPHRTSRLSAKRPRALKAAFERLRGVQRHLGLDDDPFRPVDAAPGFSVEMAEYVTPKYMYHSTRYTVWQSVQMALRERPIGNNIADEKRILDAINASLYAYIVGTPVSRARVMRMLVVGGWHTEIALQLLARAR